MRRRAFFAWMLLLASMISGCSLKEKDAPAINPPPKKAAVTKPELRVAAAADLAKAFTEVGAKFEAKTGHKAVFTFGASGTIAKQIENGAPFDVFAAANEAYIDKLAQSGRVTADTKKVYAIGQLILWTRKGSLLAPKSVADLTAPRFAHIALANPEHAPYGKAAQEALQTAKLWAALKPRLVYGENAQQAFEFAQRGNADAALTSHALTFGTDGDALLVPQNLYKPLRQAVAAISASEQSGAAREFIGFVTGPEGREILRKYGFALP